MDAAIDLFEYHRSRLFGLAYRMLGTPADAEAITSRESVGLAGDAAGVGERRDMIG